MTRIARLRARVGLARPETTPDDIGGAGIAWVAAGAAWAEIESVGGGAGARLDGQAARTTYRVVIRMRRDVAPGWRVAWGDRTLSVRAIADADPQAAFLSLECEEEFL